VFYTAAAVSTIGNLFYVVFASATEQPWSVEISRKIKYEKEFNRTSECMYGCISGNKNVTIITLVRGT
jgi:hypothetical protein